MVTVHDQKAVRIALREFSLSDMAGPLSALAPAPVRESNHAIQRRRPA